MSCWISEQGLQIGAADTSIENRQAAAAGVAECSSVLERGSIAHHQSAQRKQDTEQCLQSHNTVFHPILTLESKREKHSAASSKYIIKTNQPWGCAGQRGQHGTVVCCPPDHLYWRPDKWGSGPVIGRQRLTMDSNVCVCVGGGGQFKMDSNKTRGVG